MKIEKVIKKARKFGKPFCVTNYPKVDQAKLDEIAEAKKVLLNSKAG